MSCAPLTSCMALSPLRSFTLQKDMTGSLPASMHNASAVTLANRTASIGKLPPENPKALRVRFWQTLPPKVTDGVAQDSRANPDRITATSIDHCCHKVTPQLEVPLTTSPMEN